MPAPMLCAKLPRPNEEHNGLASHMERALAGPTPGYERALRWVVTRRWQPAPGRSPLLGKLLQARWLVIGVMLLCAAIIGIVWPTMKSELSPMEDRGTILATINAPDGATLDYTDRYAKALERIGGQYKEFDKVFANLGNPTVSQGNVQYRAVDWDERKRSTLDIAREMAPKFNALPGVNAFPITPPSLGQGFRER